MSTFYRQFLLEDARARPRAHLAAFGKHPGWNDHIDDFGLETESLILAKQTIYLEGLSSQIDAGAWEKLAPENQLEDFDHVFLWQRRLNVMVGALVASRDGKGRARYPMIVCAQFNGASPGRIWREWWPLTHRALEDCRATSAATDVVEILTQARAALRRATTETPPPAQPAPAAPPESLAGHPGLGPADEGLVRVLYQIRNQLAGWAPGRVPAKLDQANVRSVHLRLPQLFTDAPAGLQTWSVFFASQLDSETPRLFLWPRAGTWFDLIVGRPSGQDFFCLRANSRALPCATDVPFTMEESDRDLAQVVIDDVAKRTIPVRSIFDRSVAREAAVRRKHRSGTASGRGRGRWWFAGLVAVLAVSAGAYGVWYWDQHHAESSATAPGPSAGETPAPLSDAAPNPPSTPVDTAPAGAAPAASTFPAPVASTAETQKPATPQEAWLVLCAAYDTWLGSLEQAIDEPSRRRHWARNPYLQGRVLAPLHDARVRFDDLDPRRLAGVSGDLRTLRRSPPSALQDAGVQTRVQAAAAVTIRIATALHDWPILDEIRKHTEEVKALGWTSIAAGIGFPEAFPLNDRLAPTVDYVLSSWQTATTLAELGGDVLSGLQQLESSGDPALATLGRTARQRLLAMTIPEDLKQELRQVHADIAPVQVILTQGWHSGAIARDRFLRERGEHWGEGLAATELLQRWTAEIPAYAIVPETELPLPAEQWRSLVVEVENSLRQLETKTDAATVTAPRSRLTELTTRWNALRNSRPLRKELATTETTAGQLVADIRQLNHDVIEAFEHPPKSRP